MVRTTVENSAEYEGSAFSASRLQKSSMIPQPVFLSSFGLARTLPTKHFLKITGNLSVFKTDSLRGKRLVDSQTGTQSQMVPHTIYANPEIS